VRIEARKWGNSLAVRIPKGIAEGSGLSEGDTVEIANEGDRIVITPSKIRRYSLTELLDGITKKNLHSEVDTGKPVGRELI